MEKTQTLINQLIEIAMEQDRLLKQVYAAKNKSSFTLGESNLVFHLKQLRTLVEEEHRELAEKGKKLPKEIVLRGKKYHCAYGQQPEVTDFVVFSDGERLPFTAP